MKKKAVENPIASESQQESPEMGTGREDTAISSQRSIKGKAKALKDKALKGKGKGKDKDNAQPLSKRHGKDSTSVTMHEALASSQSYLSTIRNSRLAKRKLSLIAIAVLLIVGLAIAFNWSLLRSSLHDLFPGDEGAGNSDISDSELLDQLEGEVKAHDPQKDIVPPATPEVKADAADPAIGAAAAAGTAATLAPKVPEKKTPPAKAVKKSKVAPVKKAKPAVKAKAISKPKPKAAAKPKAKTAPKKAVKGKVAPRK